MYHISQMSNKSLIIHLVYLLPMPLGIMKHDKGINPLMARTAI